MLCERINSFAKIFDDSIRAADLSGPNTRNFSLLNRSTIPAARGSSGPTTVRSIRFSFANLTSAIKSLAGIATLLAISPVPAFPGVQKIRSVCGDCRNFHARACSRPPPPMIRIFMGNLFDCRGSRIGCNAFEMYTEGYSGSDGFLLAEGDSAGKPSRHCLPFIVDSGYSFAVKGILRARGLGEGNRFNAQRCND